jgi:Fe-S oxidoreductase/coenzyme F420-reducing hydrogenase delta subunit
MCTGRLDPIFILKAFETGFDAVLIAGCHPGDCHYIAGNEKCEREVNKIRKMMDILGIDTRRVLLEWISASEAQKFADVVTEFVSQMRKLGPSRYKYKVSAGAPPISQSQMITELATETKATYCLDCGKCSGTCPIAEFNPNYLPRAIVSNILIGSEHNIVRSRELYSCLGCYACYNRCPSDVDYPKFIRKMRSIAYNTGYMGDCAHSGILQTAMKLMTVPNLKPNRLYWLNDDLEVSNKSDILYFTGCVPIFEPMFANEGIQIIDTIKATIRVLNALGIKPKLLPNERCCGHDLLWNGNTEAFQHLAEQNAKMIRKSKVKRILFSCPEGLRTFKLDYPTYVDIDCELEHITEFLSCELDNKPIKFKSDTKKVTYHDPCRLGRHLGIYDAPRDLLAKIDGIELIEMPNNRHNSICCGTSAWMNCDSYSMQIRVNRLLEAKATQAETLITACPKCQIHFRCAMVNKGTINRPDIEIDVMDIVSLVANRLGT